PGVRTGGGVVGGPVPERHQGDPRRRVHLPGDGRGHGLRHPVLHPGGPRRPADLRGRPAHAPLQLVRAERAAPGGQGPGAGGRRGPRPGGGGRADPVHRRVRADQHGVDPRRLAHRDDLHRPAEEGPQTGRAGRSAAPGHLRAEGVRPHRLRPDGPVIAMGTAHRTPSDRPGPPRPRRRLRHRLPVRLRQHWKPAAAAAAALLALVLLLGDARIRPYITSELASEEQITHDIAGTADLFDSSVAHGIEISFDEAAYTDMIRPFQEEVEKEYIKGDVVIDGTLIEDAGLRLKGNSTLQSLRGGGTGAAPEDAAGQDGDTAQEDAGQEQGAAPGGGPGGGPGGITLSEDEPESLPWLVSFDEFVEGRAYQGRTEIALRPGTATYEAALNEALALEVTAATGQTTQEYAFSAVTVNGGTEATRLVLESPDPAYADELGEGVLYKGRANGSFAYLGEDPTDCEDAFKQINDEGEADLQPVIDLLRFVDEADDEEFAEELEDRLDTESFALYLATQDLIANNDAMDGPGNNYYLWYDRDAERFTVLSWDLNLAFGGM